MPVQLVKHLPVDSIRSGLDQPRRTFDEESLQSLAETIKTDGVMQPIVVRRGPEGTWSIVFGERRWRAAKLAGVATVPAIVEDEDAPAGSSLRIRRLLENCGRDPLPPLELADAIEAVMSEEGLTAAEVARKIGLSQGHVSKLRALRTLSPEVQKELADGKIGINVAYGAVGAGNATPAAERLARKIRGAKRVSRKKITLPVDTGYSVVVMGLDLTMQSLVGWLTKLAERARLAESNGLSLEDFASSLRPAKPIKKAGAA